MLNEQTLSMYIFVTFIYCNLLPNLFYYKRAFNLHSTKRNTDIEAGKIIFHSYEGNENRYS